MMDFSLFVSDEKLEQSARRPALVVGELVIGDLVIGRNCHLSLVKLVMYEGTKIK